MNYFKCVLAGSAASVLSGIVYILISFIISFSSDSFGWGGFVEVTFTAGPLLLTILLAGFAIGFFWMLKRTSSLRLTS